MYFSQICHAIFMALVLAALGCSGDTDLSPVRGKVRVDGRPIAGASVMFRPVEGGRPAWGKTAEDGSFVLTTYKRGDGALTGEYQVTIALTEATSTAQTDTAPRDEDKESDSLLAELAQPKPKRKKWIVPKKYSKPDSSGLTFEVIRGEKSNAVFELTSK